MAVSAAAKEPPALNPNHPNNNRPAPIVTNPKLNGPFSFFSALSPRKYTPLTHPNPAVI